jgi:hypothetical protein
MGKVLPFRRSSSASPIVEQPHPPIEAGHFKAWRRTDGKLAIVDARLHWSKSTVAVVKGEKAAKASVASLAGQTA